jgi:hypothetical protein
MAYDRVKYDFNDVVFGKTMLAVQFTVLKNAVAIDLTGATIVMEIESKKTKKRYNWSTDSELSITTPASGIFQVDQQTISLPVDSYGYGITFNLANGTIFEYIYGNLNVLDLTPNGG